MTPVLHALLVFVCGAAYEACCVGFVHFSERGRASLTALFSMLAAAAELTGIIDSARNLALAPVFVVGYGTGTYLAVRVKRWLAAAPTSTLTVEDLNARLRIEVGNRRDLSIRVDELTAAVERLGGGAP